MSRPEPHRSATRTRKLVIGATALSVALVFGACGKKESASESGPTTSGSASTGTTQAPGTTQPATIQITDPWARTSPMNAKNGAVYMTLRSPVADRLIGASVAPSIAAKVELHETVMGEGGMSGEAGGKAMGAGEPSNTSSTTSAMPDATSQETMGTAPAGDMGNAAPGMMTMKPVEAIDLPANTEVMLKPGGFHVMLIDLAAPLQVGSSFELTLQFEKAGTMTISVPIREG